MWRRWQARASGCAPVVAPEFFALTAQHLAGGEPVAVEVAAGRTGAVLPLVRRGRTLASLRTHHNPWFDVAGDDEALGALWRAVCADPDWRSLHLDGLLAGSALSRAFADGARRDHYPAFVQLTSRAPYMLLDRFEDRIDRELRRALRRRSKRLDGVEFERVTRFDPEAVEDLITLEASGWKAEQGTAIGSSAATRAFYEQLIAAFAARGQLSLSFLRAGGRRIAVQLALEDEDACYLLKIGHDPAHRAAGPGHLLIHHYAVDARARGRSRLEFLGQESRDKRQWTDQSHQRVRLIIYRHGVRGELEHAVRHVVRPRLGRARRRIAEALSRVTSIGSADRSGARTRRGTDPS